MSTSGAKNDIQQGMATGIVVESESFTVWLTDGRRIAVPYKCFPRLEQATPEERRNVEIHAGGRILSWEALDEDIEVQHIVAGRLPVKLDQLITRVAEGGVEYRTKSRR